MGVDEGITAGVISVVFAPFLGISDEIIVGNSAVIPVSDLTGSTIGELIPAGFDNGTHEATNNIKNCKDTALICFVLFIETNLCKPLENFNKLLHFILWERGYICPLFILLKF